MAQHSNYWTCSKFADWLRGTAKPNSATSEGWDEWTEKAKSAHPIRFWIADDGLDYLQDFVTWPVRKLYDIKYYINNRWVTRTHALTAHPRDIRPGNWCDVGNRFLPCLFNELVDFVEVELAWWHIAWADKAERVKYSAPFWATGWFRWRTWRCPQAGLDNLEWQRKLVHDDEWVKKDDPLYGKPTPQAVKAQEILDLYEWWTETYRNRPDPYDASGWSAYCEASREANNGKIHFGADKTPELKKMSDKAHKVLQKIEADYEAEDEAMMIRLIKVRHGLWT
jgi:hypothetical protein